ncbi:N-acetylmuramoyl-L-alanine amidase [Bacillus sp. JJ664]
MKKCKDKKMIFSQLRKYGFFTILICLCFNNYPLPSKASPLEYEEPITSKQVPEAPTANWDMLFFNNGNTIKSSTTTTVASPIKFSYPKFDQSQLNSLKSIRSTTTTKIHSGKYYVSGEFLGKVEIYVDNKLFLQDEAISTSKKIKKSILITELLNKSTSRDIHTIQLIHSNFQSIPTLNFTLKPIQQSVNLNEKDISYNWGYYSPIGHAFDFFHLNFIHSSMYKQGDYFATLYTDDLASIFFDEQKILESNPTSTNMLNNAVIENVSVGEHIVKTDYADSNGGEAAIHSAIAPFSNWVAYYFNNTGSTGLPVSKQVITSQSTNILLKANNESSSTIPSVVAKNYYSARYITYKRLPAGTYHLEYKSGEGVGVWLDGKQIAYEWKDGKKPLRKLLVTVSDDTLYSNSKDIHQLTVRTYNRKSPQDLFVSFKPSIESPDTQIKTIVIDPGHGGKDTGAIGIGGLKEKDVVLDVSQRVETLFNDLTPYNVYLTRSKDIFIPLNQRPALAISKKAHAFVSIHANAGSSSASGLETYYYGIKSAAINKTNINASKTNYPTFFSKESSITSVLEPTASKTNPYITDSKTLANFIQKRMVAAYQLQDRGAKHGNFQVIRSNNLPAVLTELGFITNKNDASKLSSSHWRQIAAEAIYMGILDFFETKGSDVSAYRLY